MDDNKGWYTKGHIYDIPRCISCNEYIITNTDTIDIDVCTSCSSIVSRRLVPKVNKLIDETTPTGISFTCEHIPNFSVITAFLLDHDIITIGVDWDEVIISDVTIENYDSDLLKESDITIEDVEKDIITMVIKLGNTMYEDLFDDNALRAKDTKFAKIISDLYNRKSRIVAWKAVDDDTHNTWESNKAIPKGVVFSLSDYYYVERNNGHKKGHVLLRMSSDRGSIIRRRNNTIKLKKDMPIDTVDVI